MRKNNIQINAYPREAKTLHQSLFRVTSMDEGLISCQREFRDHNHCAMHEFNLETSYEASTEKPFRVHYSISLLLAVIS